MALIVSSSSSSWYISIMMLDLLLLLSLLISTPATAKAASMLRGRTLSQRQIFAYPTTPPEDAFPLGLCVGDCDDDDDCETGLYCFQRGPNVAIPGCVGGEGDNSRTDYCTDGGGSTTTHQPSPPPPTAGPTPGPSSNPTSPPTSPPTPAVATSPPTPEPTIPPSLPPTSQPTHGNASPGPTSPPTTSPTPMPTNPPTRPPTSMPDTAPPSTHEVTGSLTPPPTKPTTASPSMSPTTQEPTPGPSSVIVVPTPDPTLPLTTPNPTPGPSLPPTPMISRQRYAYKGRPPSDAFPLPLCHGDCKDDSECESDLYCFQRDPSEYIPGCIGGTNDNSRTDYCTDVPPELWTTTSPPPSPTMSPTTKEPTPGPSVLFVDSPTDSPMLPAPGYRSIPNPKIYPLGQCEGDCLWHEDCADGMFCYQREPYEPIPGCGGGETDGSTTDYCTYSPPIVAPVEPPTADNFRLKMYWDDYYWQEEDFDRVWCMQCSKDGCQEGEILFLHYCAWDSARFDFVDVTTGGGGSSIQIKVVDTDLCLERSSSGGSSGATSLQLCNSDESLQHWTATGGTTFDDDYFEFSQNYDGNDYCVTTHHHPKYGEEIEMYTCKVARNDDTSYWTKY